MKTLILTTLVLAAALFFNSCNNDLTGVDSSSLEKSAVVASGYGDCTDSVFTTTIDDLSEADIEGLLFMREEEKLAHDVYVYFFNKYELTIFDRISESEARHAEAVLNLINHFGLVDPSSEEAGVFNNAELQALYNQLIEQGDASVEDALAVGGLIEETDILDLENQLGTTENTDLITVYTHLLNGSYQHLKGFSKTLSVYNVTYELQLLSSEAYKTILATTNGNGGQGKGMRNGSGQGNGQQGGKGNRGGNGGQGNAGNGGNNGQGSGDGTGTCVNG